MLSFIHKNILLLFCVAIALIIGFYEWRFVLVNQRLDELQSQIFVNSEEKSADILPNPQISQPENIPTEKSHQENTSTIQDLFDSPSNSSNSEKNIDKIKTRYEGVLVNYLLLKKCQKTSATDYQLIISAMQNDILKYNAPARLQYDILTAAKGSYDEIYARSTCEETAINSIYQKYITYIATKYSQ